MKTNKILLNITSVFCFLFGAFYIFSLVFIPIGIYCFAAGKFFSSKADHLLDNFVADKKTMKSYVIFVSIACFLFGLLSVIAYFGIYGNNVKVQPAESVKFETVEDSEDVKTEEVAKEQIEEVKEESEEEKLEKLEKLRKFKEKNIISEEEFEMAKEQMFGKDKK